ncbi:VanW family protein [Kribbella deserti]|uniref:VanW family protein n=1 Tax=Kribbella deserti TaxID=1926257 RepID=A0ABV6QML5_9ACTN
MGRKQLAGIIAAAGLGVLAVGYGAAYAFTGDKVPGETTVLGVSLGGLSEAEAKAKLTGAVKDKLDTPLKLKAGEKTVTLKPADAGLRLDVDATVEAAGAGRSLNPGRMWQVMTGGEAVEPVVIADKTKLDAAIGRVAKLIDQPATEGSITFEGVTPVQHQPAAGITLDKAGAAEAITKGYPFAGEPIALPADVTEPGAGNPDIAKALKEYAEPAMSGPIRLTVGEKFVELKPAELAPALKLTGNADGKVVPSLDAAKLEPLFKERFENLETEATDASFKIVGGKPQVVPAVDGQIVARDKVVPAILATLPKPAGERKVSIGLGKSKAKFTTEQAQALGIKEVMGAYTTYFPYAEYRNVNIGTAARKINGTLLKPGEMFSLNKIVGERTRENGFTEGNIINGGKFVLDLGGGVSQSATTTFNAAFFAGLKDVEHKAHSVYIDRYPVGREATVAWPSVDLRFQNDSGKGIFVETIFTKSTPGKKGALTVKIWGTKVWDITAGASERYNFRSPGTVYNTEPGCRPQAPTTGFDIKIYRYFAKNGTRVKTESFTTNYNAADLIKCEPKPQPPKPPTTPGPPNNEKPAGTDR